MNLKLGFATAVNYALIGVAFWMGFVCTGDKARQGKVDLAARPI